MANTSLRAYDSQPSSNQRSTAMSNWQEFLISRGAQRSSGGDITVDTHPDPDSEAPVLSVLSHQRLLQVSGPDTFKFLQGQLTCDVSDLHQGRSHLGAHCNNKGRMIADFRTAAGAEDACGLRLHSSALAPLQQSLARYIVFSKAQLQADTDTCIVGLSGAGAQSLLADNFAAVPDSAGRVCQADGVTVIKLDSARFECWIDAGAATEVLATLLSRSQLAGSGYWDLLDIRAGIGQVRGSSVEMFIPQLLNYQLIDGISFTKGCYTGQEVVARMQYRGKLKRHMYRLRAADPASAAPGDEIYGGSTSQSVGNVVMCANSDESSAELLAVCTIEAASENQVYLDRQRQQSLELLALPYAIQ